MADIKAIARDMNPIYYTYKMRLSLSNYFLCVYHEMSHELTVTFNIGTIKQCKKRPVAINFCDI